MTERSPEWVEAANSYLHALLLMVGQVCEAKVGRSLLDDKHARDLGLWAFEGGKLDLAIYTANIILSGSRTDRLFKAQSANLPTALVGRDLMSNMKASVYSLNY